jgi:hypothetical protein
MHLGRQAAGRRIAVLNTEFRKAKSRCIDYGGQTVCLYDIVSVPEVCRVILTFEGVNSEWRQGVRLGDMSRTTDLELTVAGQCAPGVQLWSDRSPNPVEIAVKAPKGKLYAYNIWDPGSGQAMSQVLGAGMIIEESPAGTGRWYRCNDGHALPTFTHLAFSIQVTDPVSG